MNIENYQAEKLDLSPLKMSDIDDTITELATINEFQPVKVSEYPDDLVETIINLNL